MRFHINEAGEPKSCSAKIGNCPFGNELEHYTNPNDARKAFEKVMSKIPWTGHSFDKVKWDKKSWNKRKVELENLFFKICKIENVHNPKIIWKKNLLSNKERTRGMRLYGRATPSKGLIEISESLEAFSYEEAVENIIHETAHLIIGSDHESNGGHSKYWREKCEELAASIEGMEDWEFLDATLVSPETFNALANREKIENRNSWLGTCSRGHKIYAKENTFLQRNCHSCLIDDLKNKNTNLPETKLRKVNWRKIDN